MDLQRIVFSTGFTSKPYYLSTYNQLQAKIGEMANWRRQYTIHRQIHQLHMADSYLSEEPTRLIHGPQHIEEQQFHSLEFVNQEQFLNLTS